MLLPRDWAELKKDGDVYAGWVKRTLTGRDEDRRPAIVAPNIRSFVDYVSNHKPKSGSSTYTHNDGWYGTRSLDQTIDLFRNKRHELLPKGFQQKYIKNVNANGTDVEYNVTGDYLDIGRYMSGEPEVFGTNINGDLTGKVVSVYINASVSARYDAEEIMLGAEKLAEVINALYVSGARVSTTFMSAEETQWIEVKLNDFGDPINPVDLVAVASPSFIRRLCFAVNNYFGVSTHGSIVDVLNGHRDILNKGEDLVVYITPNGVPNFNRTGAVDKALSDIKEAIEWENTKTLVLKP
jgi:hypothetical protein